MGSVHKGRGFSLPLHEQEQNSFTATPTLGCLQIYDTLTLSHSMTLSRVVYEATSK